MSDGFNEFNGKFVVNVNGTETDAQTAISGLSVNSEEIKLSVGRQSVMRRNLIRNGIVNLCTYNYWTGLNYELNLTEGYYAMSINGRLSQKTLDPSIP